jgi:SAM-dependent methyltransferase
MRARGANARMRPKPAQLAERYAEQFQDASVAAAYCERAPYPEEVYSVIRALLGPRPHALLDLGCGTGELARRLAPELDHIDAVDASAAMLARARALPGAAAPSLHWHHCSAEAFAYPRRYSLALAAESFHWFDWARVAERLAPVLDGPLLLVLRRSELGSPWAEALAELVPQFSTNSEYEPCDLVAELEARGLFELQRRLRTAPVTLRQSVSAYVESFHSRNGFSRERMSFAAAVAFDVRLRELVRTHARRGVLELQIAADLACGRLRAQPAPAHPR